jgi:four helix bundle protein
MYKDLTVWKKAYQFTLNVYKATRQFPKEELFGITVQMRRAAASIPANIAEGNMRQSPKDYQHFIRIARGSMAEMEVWLSLSHDLGYLESPAFNALAQQCDEIGRLLNGLFKSLSSASTRSS